MASTVELVLSAKDQASKEINKVSNAVGELDQKSKSFTESAATTGMALSSWIGIAGQLGKSVSEIYKFAEAGSQIQRITDAGSDLASSFGSDMDGILSKLKEVSHGTVSELDLVTGANRAMMLNVTTDAAEMARLFEVAAFRARAMGVSTSQAFNDIVTGIGRNSPLILDNLGIITKGWAEQAKAAGVAYDQQFILNKVLEQGGEMLDRAGGLARDNAAEYEILAANTENFWNTMKVGASEAFTPVVRFFNEMAEGNAIARKTEDAFLSYAAALGLTGVELEELRGHNIDGVSSFQMFSDEVKRAEQYGLAWEKALRAQGYAAQELTGGVDDLREKTMSLYSSNEDLLSLTMNMQTETQKFNEKNQELETTLAALVLEQEKYREGSKAYNEIGEKIDSTKDKIKKLAEEHEEAGKRIAFSLLQQKLAIDGLSAVEFEFLLQAGVEWGILDEAIAESASNMDKEMAGMAASLEEPAQKLKTILQQANRLRIISGEEYEFFVNIYTTGKFPSIPGGSGGVQASAPEMFHGGGISRGAEGGHLAVLHGTEGVFTQEQMRHLAPVGSGAAGGAVVNLTYAPTISTASARELQDVLMPFIQHGINQSRRQA